MDLHSAMVKDGTNISIDEIDQLCKYYGDADKSCLDMTNQELHDVIEVAIQLGQQVGVKLEYPNEVKDDIDLDWNRTENSNQ